MTVELDEHLLNIIKEAEMKFEPVMGHHYYLYQSSFLIQLEACPAGEWKAL